MTIPFNKYHGTGNDFIIIDNRDDFFNPYLKSIVNKICSRRYGVGADGLILLCDHKDYDYEMKYFNADGNESTMCGNGGRCTAAFAVRHAIAKDDHVFLAADGPHRANINENIVSLEMMDVSAPVLFNGYHFIDTGSPHYIIPVPDISKIDVSQEGKTLRWSELFAPGGTNVNFIEHTDEGINIRTFERGVEAETLSCGTGVTASAISSRWGKTEGHQQVIVKTSGGLLFVEFTIRGGKITDVSLRGPTQFVYSGIIHDDLIKE